MSGKNVIKLLKQYHSFLPDQYLHQYSDEQISEDLFAIEQLNEKNPLEIIFFKKNDEDHLKILQFSSPAPLSKILPELDQLGIFVKDKQTYRINFPKHSVWISDYNIDSLLSGLDRDTLSKKFKETIQLIWNNKIESDRFNSLVLTTNLSWQQVLVIRAYTKYLQQLGTSLVNEFIVDTVIHQGELIENMMALFVNKFDISIKNSSEQAERDKNLREAIHQDLDAITNLDQDFLMRCYYNLIDRTVRTNYFQCLQADDFSTLVFKFQIDNGSSLWPAGLKIDAFVYSNRFEAIHRRSSQVARGGIRWSDRIDFATEILGLMKTQTVKNSVIVPTGAKGGFLLKRQFSDPKMFYQEGVDCYKLFISALLSITDNRKEKEIVHPQNTICYDGDDPYLVVAADKGTANFSDIANAISLQDEFWLHDAFASGGATGYNHKVMGITARGAWEAVKRHFLELDVNIYNQFFTAIGVGDMSGDVFGNGMILSPNLKLIAAFDHRHIFIDPTPDPVACFEERIRLFNLPSSSWDDFDKGLISQGGGVFSRAQKSIQLTPEIKQILEISDDNLSPNDLIKAILKAPVDLFWNGGIGTFVKASFEAHEQAADNISRNIRIDANELRCRIVGEGGNLGFTQNARIQYAAKGGRINTDFIDNVGGVDCSDREVNIKIVLNALMQEGSLTFEQRNQILREMQEEVSQLVLKDAHDQALAISLIETFSSKQMDQFIGYLNYLEKEKIIDREKMNLPNEEELIRMKSNGQKMLRPQIAILMAHTKLLIKNIILKSDIPEYDILNKMLVDYFPERMHQEQFVKAIENNLLHREIIATVLSNDLVNRMGLTYLYGLRQETGASFKQIITAFIVIDKVFNLHQLQNLIESLDYAVPVGEQYEIFSRLQDLTINTTHWFIFNENITSLDKTIECYKNGMEKLYSLIPQLMVGQLQQYMYDLIERLAEIGISKQMATKLAVVRALYSGLNIIYLSHHYRFDLEQTAQVYFFVGQYFDLVWFRDNLFLGTTGDYWDRLVRTSLRNKFDKQQRNLTKIILEVMNKEGIDINEAISKWQEQNLKSVERWKYIVTRIKAITTPDLSMFFVAAQELSKLSHASKKGNNKKNVN